MTKKKKYIIGRWSVIKIHSIVTVTTARFNNLYRIAFNWWLPECRHYFHVSVVNINLAVGSFQFLLQTLVIDIWLTLVIAYWLSRARKSKTDTKIIERLRWRRLAALNTECGSRVPPSLICGSIIIARSSGVKHLVVNCHVIGSADNWQTCHLRCVLAMQFAA